MPGRTHCIACGTALPLSETESNASTVSDSTVPVSESVPTDISPIGEYPPVPAEVVLPVAPITEEVSEEVVPVMVSSMVSDPRHPEISIPGQGLDGGVQAQTSWLDPSSDQPNNSVQAVEEPVANEIPTAPIQQSAGESSPRVNVQYNAEELDEVPMPIHQESKVPAIAPHEVVPNQDQAGESEVLEEHTGPWLALTVLGIVLIVVILVVYFIYNWLSGGSSAVVQPTVIPTPSVTQTVTPTITSTPISQLSNNDAQREHDVNDLKIALTAYYQAKQRYPGAATYNGLLNALIGGGYLNRRVQDPAFPATEYAYAVDSTGQSYDITITFDSIVSSLLAGTTSPVYRLRGASGN